MKKILAVIPARCGSKRIVKKNIRPLGGKPLIEWTISAAIDSNILDILVSTDDPEIANLARELGLTIPWLRPGHLSTDNASSIDVLAHALDWYQHNKSDVDAVIMLQPTSPFRTADSIRSAVNVFFEQQIMNKAPVISVSPLNTNIEWCFKKDGDTLEPVNGWAPFSKRSQDLANYYTLNGSIYILNPVDILSKKQIVRSGFIPYFIDDFKESIDIDTENDWLLAESILRK